MKIEHILLLCTSTVDWFVYAANGFSRAEGVVAVYLQKKESANRVYATVVHSKSNSDGYKEEGILALMLLLFIL